MGVPSSFPSDPITTDDARNVALEGRSCYLADGRSGLKVIDVADPSRPRVIGVADLPGAASDIAVRRDVAYVAAGADETTPLVPVAELRASG